MRVEDPDRSLEFLDECQPVMAPYLSGAGR
jgi:hypothetical protein